MILDEEKKKSVIYTKKVRFNLKTGLLRAVAILRSQLYAQEMLCSSEDLERLRQQPFWQGFWRDADPV